MGDILFLVKYISNVSPFLNGSGALDNFIFEFYNYGLADFFDYERDGIAWYSVVEPHT